MPAERWTADALIGFAAALCRKAGFDDEKAAVTARLLVEADMLGHTTHGLQLLAPYLAAAEAGTMRTTGEPKVLADRPAALTWDGDRLPGVWLTDKALGVAIDRARELGTAMVAIRRSHHIACLAAFLPRATDAGMMAIISSSDPSVASVAPYGGRQPLYTPDPIAIGIPTDGDPILVDISASITTNGLSGRYAAEGRRMPHPWLLDGEGNPTDDPNVLAADPPGTILPVGGLDHGHKGYGLALMIEALTQGLPGFGRADPGEGWGASVTVQVIDPACFAGSDAFNRQTGWLARACRESPPRPGVERVRLPGENGLARKRKALADGVELYPGIMAKLTEVAGQYGVEVPKPLG
ncbi:MAG: Ldh family oxidoreductase [Geminicoccaceae bacterium]